MNFQSEFKHFLTRKCIWKCGLENSGHFVSTSMCWYTRNSVIYISYRHIFWIEIPIPGPEFYLWLSKVLANERRHCIRNFFSRCLRPYSIIDSRRSLCRISVYFMNGCSLRIIGHRFLWRRSWQSVAPSGQSVEFPAAVARGAAGKPSWCQCWRHRDCDKALYILCMWLLD